MKNLLTCTGIILLLFLSSCGKEVEERSHDDMPAKPPSIGHLKKLYRVVSDVGEDEISFYLRVSRDGGKTWSWDGDQAFISLGRKPEGLAPRILFFSKRRLEHFSFVQKNGAVYLAFVTHYTHYIHYQPSPPYWGRENPPSAENCVEYFFVRHPDSAEPFLINTERYTTQEFPGFPSLLPLSSPSASIELGENGITYIAQGSVEKKIRKWHSKDGGKTWQEPPEPIARVVPDIDDNKIRFLYSVSEDGGETWSWHQVFASLDRGVKVLAKAGVHAGPRCLDRFSFRFKDGVVYLAFITIHSYRDNGPDISHFEFYFARSDTETAPVRITSGRGGLKTLRPDVSEAFIEFHGESIIYVVQSRGCDGSIPKPGEWRSDDGGKTWKKV